MWFDEGVFYQIYPLGFCGAERENDFGETRHRLSLLEEELPRLHDLGVTAILLNPLFESERHGYDTVDFYMVDRRLGTNEELKALIKTCHDFSMKVVFDGVFHHVGRVFPPFLDVKEKRERSEFCGWFYPDFRGNSRYNDGFSYACWEGHQELVKLNLENPAVQKYLMDAVRFWIREFDIDGLRLDVSYSLPLWFLELLRRTVNAEKQAFFLMGEVIRLDGYQGISDTRLDSCTNYEGFRSMLSAFNSSNLFEIEYSLTRLFGEFPWCLFRGKRLFSFVDNHDVERAATSLHEKRDLPDLYTLLFTMPGIPCLYYGSEYGAEGDRSDLDYKLRPFIGDIDKTKNPELYRHIKTLCFLRKQLPALSYGGYRKLAVQSKFLAFVREGEGSVAVAINIADEPASISLGEGESDDLLTGRKVSLSEVVVPPHSSVVCRM